MYIIELNTIKKINLIFIILKVFFSINNKFLISFNCFISITLSSERANDSKMEYKKKKLKMNILFVVFDKINYIYLHLHKFDALYYH